MTKKIFIAGREISEDSPPYIVAELSANHGGSIELAKQTITAAAKCGADAIKLQTYTPDTMTIDCDADDFKIKGGLWDGYTLYQLYKEAHTPFEWHKPLFDHARSERITCFSSPFDETAVDLLEDLNVPAYKIASFETVDLPLIKYVAQTKKPMIISTGLANLNEISEAVDTAKSNGCQDLILLHCISAYPAPTEEFNLNTITSLRKHFDILVGLSDHSLSNIAAIASVALGACFIEKHFILDSTKEGPDSSFSITPKGLTELISSSRQAFTSLGSENYKLKSSEEGNAKFRRSLYIADRMKAGDTLKPSNIRRIRPGYGLAPKYLDEVIGKRVKQDIEPATPITWDIFL